jgi:hypothetical protein
VTSPPYYGLFQIFTGGILFAMYPMVAQATKGNEVVHIKAQGRIARPGLDVMGAQTTRASVGRTATGAMVIVPLVNRPNKFFPVTGRIQALAFWRTAILEVGIAFACSARHAIGFAAQPGLFDAGFLAQCLARFFAVSLALKWINRVWLAHVAIAVGEVVTAWARRDAEVYELFVDSLRVTADQLADVVRGEVFDHVLLVQPVTF